MSTKLAPQQVRSLFGTPADSHAVQFQNEGSDCFCLWPLHPSLLFNLIPTGLQPYTNGSTILKAKRLRTLKERAILWTPANDVPQDPDFLKQIQLFSLLRHPSKHGNWQGERAVEVADKKAKHQCL